MEEIGTYKSIDILKIIRDKSSKLPAILTKSELDNVIREYKKLLKLDSQGYLRKLYEYACKNNFTDFQKYKCLNGRFYKVLIKDFVFDCDFSFLESLVFDECIFENITFNQEIQKFFADYYSSRNLMGSGNVYKNVRFSKIDNFHYSDVKTDRIGSSPFTTRVNLYLELGRFCNAKCPICRNKYYEPCNYDLEAIKNSLSQVSSYLSGVVIGGGEPTLLPKDLLTLHSKILRHNSGVRVSSNLSCNNEVIKKLLDKTYYGFLASRHAISSSENKEIFGFTEEENANAELNLRFLSQIRKTMLSTVCFKDGINSFDKLIEYLKWGVDMKYKDFLIQTMHPENSVGTNLIDFSELQIDTAFFQDAIKYLIDCLGFSKKPEIYSTAGYKSTVLNKGEINIAFKEYVAFDNFDEIFQTAIKRTIDLSISPDGRVYENYHQNSGEVILPAIQKRRGSMY